jgi:hypothetical protein
VLDGITPVSVPECFIQSFEIVTAYTDSNQATTPTTTNPAYPATLVFDQFGQYTIDITGVLPGEILTTT